jgi:surfeit locus 1 family protein
MRVWRRLVVPGIAALIVCAILVGLGVWQVNRLAWKEALIAEVTARIGARPVAAPGPLTWPGIDLADLEYQPVTVNGKYQNNDEIHVVYALTEPKGKFGGLGDMVMTPFVTDAGWIVYVNRGFVPEAKIDPATRPGSRIEGETTVTGLLRRTADRAWFMPGDDSVKNEWFSRDPKLYAAAQSLPAPSVAPYLIDAKFDPSLAEGVPQGGETVIDFPNNHLGYAITWFGLALCCAGVFTAFAVTRLRAARS